MEKMEFMSLFKDKVEKNIYDLKLVYDFYKENGVHNDEIPEETGVLLEIIQEDLLKYYFNEFGYMIRPQNREKKYEDLDGNYMICQEESLVCKRILNNCDDESSEEIYYYDIDKEDININNIRNVKELINFYKKDLMLSEEEINLINKESFYNFSYEDSDPYDVYYHIGVIVDLNKVYEMYLFYKKDNIMKV